MADANAPSCRFCDAPLRHTFVDLGFSPLSNEYLNPEDLECGEVFYPLHAYVCETCFLVQLPSVQTPEHIFSDYAYFSSYSDSWLAHSERYVEDMVADYGIGADDYVVEVASNDGYLLQYFDERGVPVLGIEPAKNVAAVAQEKGLPTVTKFLGEETARALAEQGHRADLLIGNNVLAHVPDLNDFVEGMKLLLKPQGFITVEFPHLLRLMEENEFDTIYHEHFSYFSLQTAAQVFAAHGLTIFDVEELSTHGGSLRIYARHSAASEAFSETGRVADLIAREHEAGLNCIEAYAGFSEQVKKTKRTLLSFLIEKRCARQTVVGYGAPAKGNTLLNYCGVGTDLLNYTVDRNPRKQGRYLPGTRIPIYAPEHIFETRPDYVMILPWNLKEEITEQMAEIGAWGGKFVEPIPEAHVLEAA